MAGTLQILFDAATGKYVENVSRMGKIMAQAATASVKDVGTATVRALKANLAGGGFPSRWQNSVKATYKPRGSPSIDASVHVYSTINFLSVFENGARIGGKPYLWLPLPDIPQKIGSQPMRPALFIAKFGPLVSAKHSSVPLLLGQIATLQSGRIGKKTARKFRNARGAPNKAWVPVFIGISTVRAQKTHQLYLDPSRRTECPC